MRGIAFLPIAANSGAPPSATAADFDSFSTAPTEWVGPIADANFIFEFELGAGGELSPAYEGASTCDWGANLIFGVNRGRIPGSIWSGSCFGGPSVVSSRKDLASDPTGGGVGFHPRYLFETDRSVVGVALQGILTYRVCWTLSDAGLIQGWSAAANVRVRFVVVKGVLLYGNASLELSRFRSQGAIVRWGGLQYRPASRRRRRVLRDRQRQSAAEFMQSHYQHVRSTAFCIARSDRLATQAVQSA